MKKNLDASKGGKARAEKLTPEQRREIAIKAAEKRWGRILPRTTHSGVLRIGDAELECAVLDDGTRVLTEAHFMEAMGMYRSGAISVRRRSDKGSALIPLYLAHKNLKPFLDKHLGDVHLAPLRYRTTRGGIAHGIKADVIPAICDVWLDAEATGVLGKTQKKVAAKAALLVRALAHVGIVALVDEATGYQDARARDALARILEAFVANELRKWVRTFPPDFYKELFRLRKLPYNGSLKRPQFIGHDTNNIVYSRLAPGVLDELRRKNPAGKRGARKSKHHQWLTDDTGHPKLQQHLAAVTALMKVSDTWSEFKELLNRALPKQKRLPLFDGPEP